MGEKIASSISGVGKTGHLCVKEWKRPCTKIKWIKDLNVRPETIKLIEENIGSKLFDINLSSVFLDLSSQARATKAKNKQMEPNQPTEWENIFANTMSDGG